MLEGNLNPTQKTTEQECLVCYKPCICYDDVHSGISYCPKCGAPVCPQCGSADVVAISRVTGYLSDISGWGAGKRQELKDRHRYNPIFGGQ